jgi:hypothetical protein
MAASTVFYWNKTLAPRAEPGKSQVRSNGRFVQVVAVDTDTQERRMKTLGLVGVGRTLSAVLKTPREDPPATAPS